MTVALTIALVGSIMVFAAPYSNKAALLCGYYFVRTHSTVTLYQFPMFSYCSHLQARAYFTVPCNGKIATNFLFATLTQIYAFPTGYILLLAMASANVAGHTKKVVTNSLLLIGYSAGK